MNGEWVYIQIVSATISCALVYIAYRLGIRSQKIQALREYIKDIVREVYPALFQEMKFNSEILDDYLEKPNINFNFPELGEVYDRGFEEFMKKHHKDLFSMVDSFHKNTLPKFDELDVGKLMKKLSDVSSHHLRASLPKEVAGTSESIAHDLFNSINRYYAIPDLLNDRDKEVRNKIEGCIVDRTSHIYQEKAKTPFITREQKEAINYERISQEILEKAKPEAKYLVDRFKKLKQRYDCEVKDKLLPLLQRYISNPV